MAHGKMLYEKYREIYPVSYMLEHQRWVHPVILLDNTDRHLEAALYKPGYADVANGFQLVEGHLRFNAATFLATVGKLQNTLDVWLMERRVRSDT